MFKLTCTGDLYMKSLKIYLQNCYGIGELDCEFKLDKYRHVAIYATNGTMKSSFAKTLKDFGNGKESKDIFFDRPSRREITDGRGASIQKDAVLVIESRPSDDMVDASASILVNERLKSRYDSIMSDLFKQKTHIMQSLSKQSGCKRSTEDIFLQDFNDGGNLENIFDAVQECAKAGYESLEYLDGVKYDDVLNDKVSAALQGDVEVQLQAYLQKYKELVSQSPYLSMDFDHHGASDVGKKLGAVGFFDVGHSINLNRKNQKGRIEIAKKEELTKLVEAEKSRIWKKPKISGLK